MLWNYSSISRNIFTATLLCCTFFVYSIDTFAWSADGHTAIGILALAQLQEDSRRELAGFVNLEGEQAMAEACNWPDVLRETEKGAATGPRHYINIPRGDFDYLQSRDCPDGQCATEAIKHYAAEMADRDVDKEKRWQAFAWLCHVVGDLHQPLHAGFADDRGGNNVEVVYQGEPINLHELWDFELINQNAGGLSYLVEILDKSTAALECTDWSEPLVDEWTNESHQLARHEVYPEHTNIEATYVQQSWELAQHQLALASSRLAWIINSVLKERD